MRRLLLGLAMATLVMARPELYREKEDFQYSRSSTDEGTKSGFYDAQRGNMGGNFEKAHNMDSLAQHQMGGLVKQVEGELGDGSQTRTGSVYTAANSRGVFGSGRYDLSNLAGRNFHEGANYGDSQLQSSSNSAYDEQSSSHQNARYSTTGRHISNSGYRGYQGNSQGAQNLYDGHQYEQGIHGHQYEQGIHGNQYEQGIQSGQSSRHHSQSGYEGQTAYEQLNTNHLTTQNEDANTHHRLISTVPVKIIVRPGQRIAIPIATQTHSGSQIASYYNQNTVNSDAELLSTSDQQQSYKPSNNAKQYESSYSYRKEWEKHNTRPSVVPLAIPTTEPKKSELHDDTYLQRGSQYSAKRNEENVDFNSAFSQSQHQSDFNARHQSSASSNSNLNAFNQLGTSYGLNTHAANANLVGPVSSKPKGYESSYSYHKSWERQGDPYVIKPATNGELEGQTSGRLTDASASQAGHSSHSYEARQTQNQQRYSLGNCNYECEHGHSRVARSSDQAQYEQQKSENLEDLGQQTQTQWDNLSELGQQTQDTWDKSENLEQQVQNKENLEDFGQQTQNTWSQTGQQSQNKLEKFENIGQQTQNTFDNVEDLGQQTETKWDTDSVSQQHQSQTNIDLGQQISKVEQLADLGQQTQNKWNEDMTGQQTQSDLAEFGQFQTNQQQDIWNQQTSTKDLEEFEQQTHDKRHQLSIFGNEEQINSEGFQQTPVSSDKTNFYWYNLDKHEEEMQKVTDTHKVLDYNEGQTSVQQSYQQDDMTQQTQGSWDLTHDEDKLFHRNTETHESSFNGFHEKTNSDNTGSLTGLWGKLDTLDEDYVPSNMNNENSYFSQSSSLQHSGTDWHPEQSYHQTNSDTVFPNNQKNYTQNNNVNRTGNVENNSSGKTTNVQIEIQDFKTTTQKTQTESVDQRKYNNNDIKNSTDSEENFEKVRPGDIGRGDIGPEESLLDVSVPEKRSKDSSDLPADQSFTIDNKEKKSPQEIGVLNQETIFNNTDQQSNLYGHKFDESEHTKINIEQVEELPQNVQKQTERHNMKTESFDQQNTQEFQVFDQNSFSEQSKDIGQETQHFVDTLQTFETQNQNINQDNVELLSNLNQHNKQSDQQVNWNQESQNTEQQSVSDFSQQNQAPLQNFDQQFVDFGQQHETNNKYSEPQDLVPESVNFDQSRVSVEKPGQSKSNDERQIVDEIVVPKRHNPDYHVMGIAEEKHHDEKVQNIEKETTPVEVVTEKSGFWQSVGNKFSSAKSKVASWFGS